MTTIIIFLILIPILALLLLMVNRFLALHVPYQAKNSPFECGFSSYEQTRAPAAVNYYEYAFFFILFELELLLSYPVGVSLYTIEEQGFGVMIMFFILLTLGFIYELGKNALCLESKQMFNFPDKLYFEEDNTINSVSNIPVFKQKILFSGFTFNIRKEFLFLLIALIVVGFTLYTVYVDFAVTSVFSNQYFKVSILCFILNVTVYIGYICISKKKPVLPFKKQGAISLILVYATIWYLELNLFTSIFIIINLIAILWFIPLFIEKKGNNDFNFLHSIDFSYVINILSDVINNVWIESFRSTDFTFLHVVLIFITLAMLLMNNVIVTELDNTRTNWRDIYGKALKMCNSFYNYFRENTLQCVFIAIICVVFVLLYIILLNLFLNRVGLCLITNSYLHFCLAILCRVVFIKIIIAFILFVVKDNPRIWWTSMSMNNITPVLLISTCLLYYHYAFPVIYEINKSLYGIITRIISSKFTHLGYYTISLPDVITNIKGNKPLHYLGLKWLSLILYPLDCITKFDLSKCLTIWADNLYSDISTVEKGENPVIEENTSENNTVKKGLSETSPVKSRLPKRFLNYEKNISLMRSNNYNTEQMQHRELMRSIPKSIPITVSSSSRYNINKSVILKEVYQLNKNKKVLMDTIHNSDIFKENFLTVMSNNRLYTKTQVYWTNSNNLFIRFNKCTVYLTISEENEILVRVKGVESDLSGKPTEFDLSGKPTEFDLSGKPADFYSHESLEKRIYREKLDEVVYHSKRDLIVNPVYRLNYNYNTTNYSPYPSRDINTDASSVVNTGANPVGGAVAGGGESNSNPQINYNIPPGNFDLYTDTILPQNNHPVNGFSLPSGTPYSYPQGAILPQNNHPINRSNFPSGTPYLDPQGAILPQNNHPINRSNFPSGTPYLDPQGAILFQNNHPINSSNFPSGTPYLDPQGAILFQNNHPINRSNFPYGAPYSYPQGAILPQNNHPINRSSFPSNNSGLNAQGIILPQNNQPINSSSFPPDNSDLYAQDIILPQYNPPVDSSSFPPDNSDLYAQDIILPKNTRNSTVDNPNIQQNINTDGSFVGDTGVYDSESSSNKETHSYSLYTNTGEFNQENGPNIDNGNSFSEYIDNPGNLSISDDQLATFNSQPDINTGELNNNPLANLPQNRNRDEFLYSNEEQPRVNKGKQRAIDEREEESIFNPNIPFDSSVLNWDYEEGMQEYNPSNLERVSYSNHTGMNVGLSGTMEPFNSQPYIQAGPSNHNQLVNNQPYIYTGELDYDPLKDYTPVINTGPLNRNPLINYQPYVNAGPSNNNPPANSQPYVNAGPSNNNPPAILLELLNNPPDLDYKRAITSKDFKSDGSLNYETLYIKTLNILSTVQKDSTGRLCDFIYENPAIEKKFYKRISQLRYMSQKTPGFNKTTSLKYAIERQFGHVPHTLLITREDFTDKEEFDFKRIYEKITYNIMQGHFSGLTHTAYIEFDSFYLRQLFNLKLTGYKDLCKNITGGSIYYLRNLTTTLYQLMGKAPAATYFVDRSTGMV